MFVADPAMNKLNVTDRIVGVEVASDTMAGLRTAPYCGVSNILAASFGRLSFHFEHLGASGWCFSSPLSSGTCTFFDRPCDHGR